MLSSRQKWCAFWRFFGIQETKNPSETTKGYSNIPLDWMGESTKRSNSEVPRLEDVAMNDIYEMFPMILRGAQLYKLYRHVSAALLHAIIVLCIKIITQFLLLRSFGN